MEGKTKIKWQSIKEQKEKEDCFYFSEKRLLPNKAWAWRDGHSLKCLQLSRKRGQKCGNPGLNPQMKTKTTEESKRNEDKGDNNIFLKVQITETETLPPQKNHRRDK